MANKKRSTYKSKIARKRKIPVWALALGISAIAVVGIYFVYQSFASSNEGLRIVYCRNDLNVCKTTRSETYFRGRTANTRRNDRCNPFDNHQGTQYKLTSGGRRYWQCLFG